MKKGCVYFHQGWTDIINCLSLINICSKRYTILYAIFREDSKDLIDYYIRGLKNVIPVYIPKNVYIWRDPNSGSSDSEAV